MKKKFMDNSDEENEFDVDEPEEIQNNASDDDWTPDKDTSGGRRQSSRLRNIPISRAPIIDASSTDEENSDDSGSSKRKSKGRGRGRPPFIKKQKVSSSTTTTPVKIKTENGGKSVNSDSEPSSTTTTNSTPVLNNSNNTVSTLPSVIKVNKDFTSGAFIVLKTDAANLETDPPLWKIDGKALLQKYIPFEQEGKTFYKNTSVYSGWTINNKDNYYPVTVIFKQQTRKEHIVEFRRDQIKLGGDSQEITSSTTPESNEKRSNPITSNENSSKPIEKPIIKVKSFAVVPEEETKTLATPIPVKPVVTREIPLPSKVNLDYASGSFLVLRSDAANPDPPLWKIDGKALLQKYNVFTENGKTLYKNSAEYSGWSLSNKGNYFPVTVTFKQQIKKDHIVELNRIRWDEPNDSGKED